MQFVLKEMKGDIMKLKRAVVFLIIITILTGLCTTTAFALSQIIYYDGNGNTSGSQSAYSFDSGSAVPIFNQGTLKKTGYVFTGWNTASDGSGHAYQPGNWELIQYTTYLYAQWATDTAPTDITLYPLLVKDAATGVNAMVGTLGTTDEDTYEIFTYSLVSGDGDTDNASFNILRNRLQTNNALPQGTYHIRVMTTDSGSETYEKAFTITVTNAKTLAADTTDNNVDNDIEITFAADPDFVSAITGLIYNGNALDPSQYTVDTTNNDRITLHPDVEGNTYLRVPGTGDVVVTAAGYDDSIVSQTINAGTVSVLELTTGPAPGNESGDAFLTQPVITLKDQYGNVCSNGLSASATVTASAAAGTGTWTIGGTVDKAASGGVADFSGNGLTCVMGSKGDGKIRFDCGGANVESALFSIPEPNSSIAPVTDAFDLYTSAPGFEDIAVTLTLNGNTLNSVENGAYTLVADTDYTVSGAAVTIHTSYLATLSAGETEIIFKFSAGDDQTLTVTVTDTAPSSNLSAADPTAVYDPVTNPLAISSASDLAYLAQQVNTGGNITYTDSAGTGNTVPAGTASYRQTADIGFGYWRDDGDGFAGDGEIFYSAESGTAFTESNWTPIGIDSTNCFAGTFDGDGHVISGIYINSTDNYQGLFGYIKNSAVSNVSIEGSYIKGKSYVGAIAGYSKNSTITNCDNAGSVSGTSSYVGGITGYNSDGTIINCHNTGRVHNTASYTGGIAGYNNEATGDTCRILSCYNTGPVTGGLFTSGITPINVGIISECYNTGNINGGGYAAGIASSNTYSGSISNCYNKGDISGGAIVSGIVGENSYGSTLDHCCNYGSISGLNKVGGILGSIYDGTAQYCFNKGQVSGSAGDSYDIGGVTGLLSGGTVQYCYNTGAVSGTGAANKAGGVAGEVKGGVLQYCYNTGNVSAPANEGGVAGINTGTVTGCYYDNLTCLIPGINGSNVPGSAEGKATSEMMRTGLKTNDTGTGWTTDNWVFPDDSYPEFFGFTIELPSGDASLSTVLGESVNISGTNNGTQADPFEVSVSVGHTVSSVSLSGAAAADSDAAVKFYGKDSTFASEKTGNVGIAPGKAITVYFTVTAQDGTKHYYKVIITRAGYSPSEPHDSDDTDRDATIIVNGNSHTAGASETGKNKDGKTQTTVTVDTDKLQDILEGQRNGTTVMIPIETKSAIAAGVLTGKMVGDMEKNGAKLIIKTENSAYTIPAEEIDINAVSERFGDNVSLSDIKVTVEIAEPSDRTVKVVENAAGESGFSIVVPAVDFNISCEHGGTTVEINSFYSYVERLIAIPDGVDPEEITTGVVVKPDGTTYHVPTQILVIDGVYYAKINSLTNSTYTVVWHPIEYPDVEKHWAKDAINDMGSRMVVFGDENGDYNPGSDMTRAGFAATIVMALGLTPATGESGFNDVFPSDWYCGYIETAAAYGIVNGYGGGIFGPNDLITREQAMTMLARAMTITGLEADLTDGDAGVVLLNFDDGSDVSLYAQTGAAACIETGIVTGRTHGTIAPKNPATSAEAAVMLQRLLKKSDLI